MPSETALAHGAHVAPGHGHHVRQQHHFDSMDQQQEASVFGMWIFLVTEVLFFGGMFMAYILYRTGHRGRAAASHHLTFRSAPSTRRRSSGQSR